MNMWSGIDLIFILDNDLILLCRLRSILITVMCNKSGRSNFLGSSTVPPNRGPNVMLPGEDQVNANKGGQRDYKAVQSTGRDPDHF